MMKAKTIHNLRLRFLSQRSTAKRRGIDFYLTFNQWLYIWIRSGHLHERGRGSGKYCMARFGDAGPYDMGNVEITTNVENATAGSTGQIKSPEARAKIGAAHRGLKKRSKTEAEKLHLSNVLRGRTGPNKGHIFSQRHALTKDEAVEARKLRAKGFFIRAIQARLGSSRDAVRRALKDQNYGRVNGSDPS